MLTKNSVLQSHSLCHHYCYVVCYVEVEKLPGPIFNFVMLKPVTMYFCL